jgi:carboxymethylenebutenolidase
MADLGSAQTSTTDLTAEDGATVSAYHVLPRAAPRGGVIVVQEIFGVNGHIRSLAERFAESGYEVLAPAFFDRIEPGVELGYDAESIATARPIVAQLGFDRPLLDVKAALAKLSAHNKVFIVGFCWGGSLAYLAATRVAGLAGAVGYYGGAIARFANEEPKTPVLLHFGENDASIPLTDVEALRAKRPELELHLYPAGHGFNCDQRASYSELNARLAWQRTLAFFDAQLAR